MEACNGHGIYYVPLYDTLAIVIFGKVTDAQRKEAQQLDSYKPSPREITCGFAPFLFSLQVLHFVDSLPCLTFSARSKHLLLGRSSQACMVRKVVLLVQERAPSIEEVSPLNDIDKILDCEMRPTVADDNDASKLGSKQIFVKQYLLKWKGLSYLHYTWSISRKGNDFGQRSKSF